MITQEYKEGLRKRFPELARYGKAVLEGKLEDFQAFLNDPDSAIGRQDMYYEQALIFELERREK